MGRGAHKIMETLLTADEEEFLQDSVRRMLQTRDESEPQYSPRFWDAVRGAWSPEDLESGNTKKGLIKTFINSLVEKDPQCYAAVDAELHAQAATAYQGPRYQEDSNWRDPPWGNNQGNGNRDSNQRRYNRGNDSYGNHEEPDRPNIRPVQCFLCQGPHRKVDCPIRVEVEQLAVRSRFQQWTGECSSPSGKECCNRSSAMYSNQPWRREFHLSDRYRSS